MVWTLAAVLVVVGGITLASGNQGGLAPLVSWTVRPVWKMPVLPLAGLIVIVAYISGYAFEMGRKSANR